MKWFIYLYLVMKLTTAQYTISHSVADIKSLDNYASYYTPRFRRIQNLDNFECTSPTLSHHFNSNLEECFVLCQTTKDCNFIFMNIQNNICKTFARCDNPVRTSRTRSDYMVPIIQSHVYYYATYQPTPQTSTFSDVVFIVHYFLNSSFWNISMQYIQSFSTDIEIITAEYNGTLMAQEIETKCVMDKRIITTNPFAPSDAQYNLIHQAISNCILSGKRVIVMESSTYFNLDTFFTGIDDKVIGERCATAVFTNNQTQIILQTESSYPSKTVFVYKASDELSISMQYRTNILQERLTSLGSTAIILPNNITSSSYNTMKGSYDGDTMLVTMGVDAYNELNSLSIVVDMNCGDDLISTRFYGVHLQMYLLSTIELARNFTASSNTYNVQSLTSNLTDGASYSYSENCTEISHPDFVFVGDYMWNSEHEIESVQEIPITRYNIKSLSRISADYCSKNLDCNGFAIHTDTFKNVVSLQFPKHTSPIFQAKKSGFLSCAYRKQVQSSISIACTHDMNDLTNIKYLFYSTNLNQSQYCGSRLVNLDSYLTSFVNN